VNYILLLGGNIGDRLSFLKNAIKEISVHCGDVQKISSIYETAAWGVENQANFYNQVIEVSSRLLPPIFLQKILQIEIDLGRIRFKKWGERVIDIDILFVDSFTIDTATLSVPHPQLHNRRFTLIPLIDVAPNFIHPLLNISIEDLLLSCPDKLEVKQVIIE
jgi:2-amino-4-hydroxy-6-hydroxymethyldihydropteridine diphosphokinase